VDNDPEGQMIRHLAECNDHGNFMLDLALGELIRKHDLTVEKLFGIVSESPAWRRDRIALLVRGMKAMLDGDAIVAIHLLVPEIESAIRHLAGLNGVILQRERRGVEGFVWKNLDELFREDAVKSLFGDNLIYYLRSLLTDLRGWNVRNDVCHGIIPTGAFTKEVVCRLFHVILVLSTFREVPRVPVARSGAEAGGTVA